MITESRKYKLIIFSELRKRDSWDKSQHKFQKLHLEDIDVIIFLSFFCHMMDRQLYEWKVFHWSTLFFL